jgi:hypothetical protein
MSVSDGKAFTNKMHIECLHSLIEENGAGFWEYSPFGGERPNSYSSDRIVRTCFDNTDTENYP